MLAKNELAYKSENLPEYDSPFESYDTYNAYKAKNNTVISINFYPRSMASGKDENKFFGVVEVNGKVVSINSIEDIVQTINQVLGEDASVVFTPF
jgi:hypothetical protein